jgi:DNA-binding response OmpR family regulator
LRKLEETDPDLALADVFLPGVSGYELCRHIKGNERRRHTAVVLIAGLLEPVDEAEASRVAADGVLKKPFEASGVLETIRPLIDKAQQARGLFAAALAAGAAPPAAEPGLAPKAPEIDPERVRAAVTIALDRSLPQMVNEITEKVLIALGL